MGTHGLFICSVTESKVVSNVESMTYSYYQSNVKPDITERLLVVLNENTISTNIGAYKNSITSARYTFDKIFFIVIYLLYISTLSSSASN